MTRSSSPFVTARAALVAFVLAGGVWAFFSSSPSGSSRSPLTAGQASDASVQSLRVDVIREIPHSTTAYTQGLLWRDGRLYESTGQYGRSRLSRINPENGTVEQQTPIPPALFGEGLALVGSELVMLTWKAERAFVYDVETFAERRTHRYAGEGWGLCYDGRRLVMSNGSDRLTFRDPATFEELGSVAVTLQGRPLTQLNELECVDDVVYANVYQDEYLVVIDPSDGRVTQWIDASGLLTPEEQRRGVDVLNGIAYDPSSDTFYITGKLWPKLFEVRFVGS